MVETGGLASNLRALRTSIGTPRQSVLMTLSAEVDALLSKSTLHDLYARLDNPHDHDAKWDLVTVSKFVRTAVAYANTRSLELEPDWTIQSPVRSKPAIPDREWSTATWTRPGPDGTRLPNDEWIYRTAGTAMIRIPDASWWEDLRNAQPRGKRVTRRWICTAIAEMPKERILAVSAGPISYEISYKYHAMLFVGSVLKLDGKVVGKGSGNFQTFAFTVFGERRHPVPVRAHVGINFHDTIEGFALWIGELLVYSYGTFAKAAPAGGAPDAAGELSDTANRVLDALIGLPRPGLHVLGQAAVDRKIFDSARRAAQVPDHELVLGVIELNALTSALTLTGCLVFTDTTLYYRTATDSVDMPYSEFRGGTILTVADNYAANMIDLGDGVPRRLTWSRLSTAAIAEVLEAVRSVIPHSGADDS
ncbi:hypothetical protein [Nocardia brasiliensis]|uniref:hypothetical protein n=1 Tax=Nocardia brasiliensis TaxID=37326 RepID=UPI0024581D5C|nr:hypothetical protein [Nocardia brasiliensis]